MRISSSTVGLAKRTSSVCHKRGNFRADIIFAILRASSDCKREAVETLQLFARCGGA
jgi:hypothetical protein